MSRKLIPGHNTQALLLLFATTIAIASLFIYIVKDAMSAEPILPTLAVEPDCLLLMYRGDNWDPAEQVASELLPKLKKIIKHGGGDVRVVSYPDSYVPVIISKRRMAEAQELLGPEMLPITPGLEWNHDAREQGSGGAAAIHRSGP